MYFIQAENGPIKIGYACDPIGRLRDLQVGNPFRLTLCCAIPGGIPEERKHQTVFDDARMTGEWFQPTDELVAHIDGGCEWTTDLQNRYLEALGLPLPTEKDWEGLCRQCGVNIQAADRGLAHGEFCRACGEFAELRAAGADPF